MTVESKMTLNHISCNGHSEHGSGIILVTGGAGYIGSHTTLQLLLEGYQVVVVDNLDNSDEEAIRRVRELAGSRGDYLRFEKVDICDRAALEEIFLDVSFDAVIHFAGLKAVGESVANPLHYYCNNIGGTLNVLNLMVKYGCKNIVFSSSATVYGEPKTVPCTEDFPTGPVNPYGRTKFFVEEILDDLQKSDPEWKVILLRYFNPVGSHPSGRIGEDPRGVPNNLMPYMQQVAVGRRAELRIFGNDYPTVDGTGVRDYIHVQDLATGHTAALDKLFSTSNIGCAVYNLGTGRGTSVLELATAFVRASGQNIPMRIVGRRPGDCAESYASTAKAEKELGWKAKYGIEEMCRDQWKWAIQNPFGYGAVPDDITETERKVLKHMKSTANGKHFPEAVLV